MSGHVLQVDRHFICQSLLSKEKERLPWAPLQLLICVTSVGVALDSLDCSTFEFREAALQELWAKHLEKHMDKTAIAKAPAPILRCC